ncbi:MAG: leucyl aminopeptidase [Alphaproteobacteria bacterium]|nr:leucyl aminopeptidase [Alphaproteobacteria bacterium]
MKISFANPATPKIGTVVVGVLDGGKLTVSAQAMDDATGGAVARAIKASTFKGSKDHSLAVLAPGGRLTRVHCMGLGKGKDVDALALQKLGGGIVKALKAHAASAQILVDAIEGCELEPHQMAAEIALGARLASYSFDKYKTKKKEHDKPKLGELKFHCADSAKAKALYDVEDKVADGVFFTRDLVSEPSNVIYPETLAEQAKTLARMGVKVQVLTKPQMKKLGMGALLGVAQGSANDPRLVVMEWNGKPKGRGRAAAKADAPVAFVGKGVTFDSGGISIKPSAGMEDMKWDMGGAGVVIGLMKALAGRKAKVNAVGVVGLVENMPSGTAQRPGDIVTSMSGQTIEVLNTDAEGRLVLADALWYTKEKYKPHTMIDLATLTGAILVALGEHYAGVFSNDDDLTWELVHAGRAVDERVWSLPLGPEYDKMIDSTVADMQNIGGRYGGSITAAQFLKRFVGDTKWAHIDIAGVTWSKTGKPTSPKGGTGFGVRLLDRWLRDKIEK